MPHSPVTPKAKAQPKARKGRGGEEVDLSNVFAISPEQVKAQVKHNAEVEDRLTRLESLLEKAIEKGVLNVPSQAEKAQGSQNGQGSTAEQGGKAESSKLTVAALKKRMKQLRTNPVERIDECMEKYTEREDWPGDGIVYAEQVAPEYLAAIYGNGKAEKYARDWLRQKGLEKHKPACEPMLSAAVTLDCLLLFDNYNILMSTGAEVLARRMYAIERVLENVTCEAEAKGDKNKCEWKWSRVYDLTYAGTQSTRVAAADKAARKLLENEGLTNKYLSKLSQ